MKKILLVAGVTALVWAYPSSAVDEHHLDQKNAASATASANTKAQQNKASAKAKSPDAGQAGMPMMENMEKMQRQMEKIKAESDPKERQKLMHEHMQTMQENMRAMHGMGGPMMMCNDQHGSMAKGDHHDKADGDMMKHHDMMAKRMDMMQMMMEQMMQHQEAQETAPK